VAERDVSVVVPTHNRPGQLSRLPESLQLQTLSRELVEVIVVDDGSEADIDSVVAAADGPIEIAAVRAR
jgi:glycosyltransferase involved in cell wall biosynthesis